MRYRQFVLIQISLLLLMAFSAFGQGVIKGTVSDTTTSRMLMGANVIVEGTSMGAATSMEGEFRIERVPTGNYTLRVRYIGYKEKTVAVSVRKGSVTRVFISMMPDVLELEGIVVEGQAVGQQAAINQQITSKTIVNVISEEKIQELPDANAAEAIGRLPGVSIQRSGGEANKVVLRGLSDRFSSITVDGVRIASTDAQSRGVDLSTIAQGTLAGVELYKALTPDKDADAIAGSVNLVTRKAPSKRLVRFDVKGSYNDIEESLSQYDLTFRYGERFFGDRLGVQVTANAEQRDRSREFYDIDYDVRMNHGEDWMVTDFEVNYTDETRDRAGVSLLLDWDTPDGGTIRFNNIYNTTTRDFIEYGRNYPTLSDDLIYSARDRRREISTYNSFLRGENYLLGLTADWGLSWARSKSEDPYDFEIDFVEPSATDAEGNPISHMLSVPSGFKGPVEDLVDYALNNFQRAYFYTAYYRGEEQEEIDQSVFLNLSKKYVVSDYLSGEFKGGGKYKSKSRTRSQYELFSPYYNEAFPQYTKLADGTVVEKDFTGTQFEDLQTVGGKILLSNFLDSTPLDRYIYGKYRLYPIINRSALREWWKLNQDGYSDLNGSNPEYERNREPDALYYDITERVSSAYVMNTLNVGQNITWIAGLRMEQENNDYASRFSPGDLSGFPVPKGSIRDTSATHVETVWLPNTHLTIKPAEFMNIRLAAYRALARPDFNRRLENFVARKAGTFYPGNSLIIGNPNLKSAKAWNFEVNTSFFSNKIGLFSVSAFYKDIDDMYHVINGLPFEDNTALDSLGITYRNPFNGSPFTLTYPYNSSQPTRVWGFEVEHQTNLRFLPGLLKNLVLGYNFSVVRSETYIPNVRIETYEETVPGIPFPITKTRYVLEENKQKLEGQPEFFGNLSLGYDISGFSARISMFHQSEYNQSFSSDRRADVVVNGLTRWDLALKQKINDKVSVMLNINNLTNAAESRSIKNRVTGWTLLNDSEIYGLTADLGVRVEL